MPSTESGPAGAGPIRETGSARVKQTPSGALLPSAGDPTPPRAGRSGGRASSRSAAAAPGAASTRRAAETASPPNQLRDAVTPNTLRAKGETWASWAPNGPRRWTPGAGAPAAKARRWRPVPSVGRDRLRRLGYWITAAGLLPLLNAESRWEETGLAIMLAGVGIALLAAPARSPGATDAPGDGSVGPAPAARILQVLAVPALGGALLVAAIMLALAVLVRA